MGKYYSVRVGRVKGIYQSWGECQKQISGFKGAKFKSFTSQTDAESFLRGVEFPSSKKKSKKSASSSQLLYHPYWDDKSSPIKQQRSKRKLFLELNINKSNYEEHCLDVYTDGSCLDNANPDKQKRRAGYGVYVTPTMVIGEKITKDEWKSNNCAELMAVLIAIKKLRKFNKHLRIMTDSQYVCNIFECDSGKLMEKEPFPKSIEDNDGTDIQAWLKNKLFENRPINRAWYYLWLDQNKTTYENKSLIDAIYKEIASYEKDIRLIHVPGHSKVFGNEKADCLAQNAATKN